MSKHNYSQYSKKNNEVVEEVIEETVENVVEETVVTPEVNEPEVAQTPAVPEVEEEPKTVTGTVVNCAKLNVRANPSVTANVVCVLNAASEVEINVEKSNKEWFSVCTITGVEGYCMRKFVEASL